MVRLFEGIFSERVWAWGTVLLVGAILTPGARTVAAALRVMGQANDTSIQNDHRVLNCATWSSREVRRRLFLLLVSWCDPGDPPMLIGVDETMERCRGSQIAARGVSLDPVRSSKGLVVTTHGLRWDIDDARDASPLDIARLGRAFFDRSGPIGALPRSTPHNAHNHDRWGQADDHARASLAARLSPGDRG